MVGAGWGTLAWGLSPGLMQRPGTSPLPSWWPSLSIYEVGTGSLSARGSLLALCYVLGVPSVRCLRRAGVSAVGGRRRDGAGGCRVKADRIQALAGGVSVALLFRLSWVK